MLTSELEDIYAAAVEQARQVVAQRYPLEECDRSHPDYPAPHVDWRVVWYILTPTPVGSILFLVAIPPTFPDSLPKIYLTKESAKIAGNIPHLDDNRYLCTFDTESIVVNTNVHPASFVFTVLEKAVQVWTDGITGTNYSDFQDEFESYWSQAGKRRVLVLFEPNDEVREVAAYRLDPLWRSYGWILADNKDTARYWLSAVHCDTFRSEQSFLYLPLHSLGSPPFPSTNRDLLHFLKEHEPQSVQPLLAFLQKHKRPTGVAFSVNVGENSKAMGVWWHPAYTKSVLKRGGWIMKQQHCAGFRPTHLTPDRELSQVYGQGEILRGSVTRIDAKRLSLRTVGKDTTHPRDKITIIGCGSVGSMIAESIVRSGQTHDIQLVDPDIIKPENVLRHYCGMKDVGLPKVRATADRLEEHFPHLLCEGFQADILDLLRRQPDALKSSSLIIVALGNFAVERRLNQLALKRSTSINCPICFVWVEPHLYGGHAVYIDRGHSGCFECCFDEYLRFIYRVVTDSRSFTMREAGCQMTYTPYDGTSVVRFVSSLLPFLLSSRSHGHNTIFSWAGNIEHALEQGIDISEEWSATEPFSCRIAQLKQNPDCSECSS